MLPGWDLEPGPPDCKTELQTTLIRQLVLRGFQDVSTLKACCIKYQQSDSQNSLSGTKITAGR